MKLPTAVIDELRVHPGTAAGVRSRSTTATSTNWLGALHLSHPKEVADRDLVRFKSELASRQQRLYATDTAALLVIFQALDAAGKDGTIKHVMGGVDPQGCRVVSFKQPSPEELRHDFLWRAARALPERGQIGIFNRSYYEETLVVRVHPELLAEERLPCGTPAGRDLWHQRFEDINAFEHHLVRNGNRVVKFFLHVSKAEQGRRFLDRIDDPAKQWKFAPHDLADRARYEDYLQAYEAALSATSTPWAPWYVIPADHKYAMRALVGGVIVDVIDQLDLRQPPLSADRIAELERARFQLVSEL